jgi:hypothetical protein
MFEREKPKKEKTARSPSRLFLMFGGQLVDRKTGAKNFLLIAADIGIADCSCYYWLHRSMGKELTRQRKPDTSTSAAGRSNASVSVCSPLPSP